MRAFISAALLVALTTAACGDSGTDSTEAGAASPAPAASSSSKAPDYVESETCRTGMRPLLDVMIANDGNISYNEFANRFDQMENGIDAAVASCSDAVTDPARDAMYQFAMANASWRVCKNSKSGCAQKIKDALTEGVSLANDADAALGATR